MAYIESTEWDQASVRRRAAGIAIALALEALFIIAILSLGMRTASQGRLERGLMTFDVSSTSQSEKSESQAKADAVTTPHAAETSQPTIPPPLLPPDHPVQKVVSKPNYIPVSKSDFDAMDLSKIPSGSDGAGGGQGSGDSKPVYGPGQGPGGAQLYPVAWYREPYDAELSPYVAKAKSVPPGATADIACVMIEHYHVENCQTISESPRGTGLASALRQAAWQFLVRPPRINGQPQLGVWVRIHFSFGTRPAKSEPAAVPDDTP